jgi:hypothetical protein
MTPWKLVVARRLAACMPPFRAKTVPDRRWEFRPVLAKFCWNRWHFLQPPLQKCVLLSSLPAALGDPE